VGRPRRDDIYVRSVNGRGSSWFRGAQTRHQAHIAAGGVEKDVDLVETDDASDAVDAAYDAKYGQRYPTIVPSIVASDPRAAMPLVRVTPSLPAIQHRQQEIVKLQAF